MTTKLACTIFLLEEGKKQDELAKRQQAKQVRLIRTISRDSEYIKHYRLSEDLINHLERELKPYLSVQHRFSGLSNRIKILCTLSFLGNGSYQKIIGKNVDTYISQTSMSRAIHSVAAALNNPEMVRKYIRFPQNSDERQVLKERFYKTIKIPGAIGCADGTRVSMKRLQHHEERYYCHKGYHAKNVLIICDADLKIIGKNVDTYISQTSMSRAIHSVVAALNNPEMVRKYIRFPQNSDERQVLKERFYKTIKIPGAIGCADGTRVSMKRLQHHEERYYCHKGYHAKNVLIICDADLNIIHVDATFGGATHSFFFTNSIIKHPLNGLHARGEKVYLLGDSGYAQRPFMMTPFNNPNQELYNNLHCSARNCIEKTIGLLKGRFRCLLVHRVLHHGPIMVSKIVIACCVLHNLCNRDGLPAPNVNSNYLIEEQISSSSVCPLG